MRCSPGSPDDEIGIRKIAGEEMGLQRLFVDRGGGDPTGNQTLDRGQEFLAPTVVERQSQNQPIVASRAFNRGEHGCLQFRIQSLQTADMPQLRALAVQFIGFPLDDVRQDAENAIDFRRADGASCRWRTPKA